MGTKIKSKTQLVKNKDNEKKVVADRTNKEDDSVFASCTFSSLGLHPTLCDQLRERMGFEGPTLVQAQAVPVVLSGRHALVNAATGTGKTIAYLAPIIHHLQSYEKRIERSDGTFALVLVPTRELCLQVHEILQKLLHLFHWIVPGYIMGGESRSKEEARLRKADSWRVTTTTLKHLKDKHSSCSYQLNSSTYRSRATNPTHAFDFKSLNSRFGTDCVLAVMSIIYRQYK
ncbi:unnamed protein product [Lathyrus sativus]|nr:unnamed protein product [Lathyrus sativus]